MWVGRRKDTFHDFILCRHLNLNPVRQHSVLKSVSFWFEERKVDRVVGCELSQWWQLMQLCSLLCAGHCPPWYPHLQASLQEDAECPTVKNFALCLCSDDPTLIIAGSQKTTTFLEATAHPSSITGKHQRPMYRGILMKLLYWWKRDANNRSQAHPSPSRRLPDDFPRLGGENGCPPTRKKPPTHPHTHKHKHWTN